MLFVFILGHKPGYGGEPDLSFGLEIKNKSKIPVIYSGNVDDKNANELLKNFDAVMIGRKAIGNQTYFLQIKIQFF
jgi:tRNA-dihydrouridine synthase